MYDEYDVFSTHTRVLYIIIEFIQGAIMRFLLYGMSCGRRRCFYIECQIVYKLPANVTHLYAVIIIIVP